jgi:hypothetical protein
MLQNQPLGEAAVKSRAGAGHAGARASSLCGTVEPAELSAGVTAGSCARDSGAPTPHLSVRIRHSKYA